MCLYMYIRVCIIAHTMYFHLRKKIFFLLFTYVYMITSEDYVRAHKTQTEGLSVNRPALN